MKPNIYSDHILSMYLIYYTLHLTSTFRHCGKLLYLDNIYNGFYGDSCQ